MNCININHPSFIKLIEDTKLNPLVLEMRVAKWQELNNTEEFPIVEDIIKTKEFYQLNNKNIEDSTPKEIILNSTNTIESLKQLRLIQLSFKDDFARGVLIGERESQINYLLKYLKSEKAVNYVINYAKENDLIGEQLEKVFFHMQANLLLNKQDYLQIINRFSQKADQKLDQKLKDFLREKLNVNTVFDFNGHPGGVIAAADILNKQLTLFKEGKLDTIAEETGHFFFESISKKNDIYFKLLDSVETWNGYNKVYEDYKNLYFTPNGEIDTNKIKREAIGQAIGQGIVRNFKAEEGNTFFKTLQEVLDQIKHFLNLFKVFNFDVVIDDIAKEILNNDTSRITSEYNLGGFEKKNTIDKSKYPVISKIIDGFKNINAEIVGSLSYREYGDLYRQVDEDIHDIDVSIPYSEYNGDIQEFFNKIKEQFPDFKYNYKDKENKEIATWKDDYNGNIIYQIYIDNMPIDLFFESPVVKERERGKKSWYDAFIVKYNYRRPKDMFDILNWANFEQVNLNNNPSVFYQTSPTSQLSNLQEGLQNSAYEALGFNKNLDKAKVISKTTAKEILNSFEGGMRENFRNVINKLLKIPAFAERTINYIERPVGNPIGFYDSLNDFLGLDILSKEETNAAQARIIVEEVIHSLTSRPFKISKGLMQGTLTQAEKEFVNNISNLRKEVLRQRPQNANDYYGLSSDEEFVARAFMDEKFQEYLGRIEVNRSNVFSKIIDYVKQLLGSYITVKDNSALQEVLGLTEEFISKQQVTPQQKQQALQLYSQYLESLNKPNTNPILQGNQEEQQKKFQELQERLSNKEFLEGAKNAFESSEELQNVYYETLGIEQYSEIELKPYATDVWGKVPKQRGDNNFVNKEQYSIKINTENKGIDVRLTIYFDDSNKTAFVSNIENFENDVTHPLKKGLGLKAFLEANRLITKRGYTPVIDNLVSGYGYDMMLKLEKQGYLSKVLNKNISNSQYDNIKYENPPFVFTNKIYEIQITPQQKQEALNAYTDYIARVSLGIIKNPSSGGYNYESKVRDIVYHGTDTKFEKFAKEFIGKKEKGALAYGFNFGGKQAKVYAGNFGRGKKVLLSNLVELKSPLILKGVGKYATASYPNFKENSFLIDILKRNGFDVTQWQYFKNSDNGKIFDYVTDKVGLKTFTNILQKEGFDGVLSITENKENPEIVVFEPEQIHVLGGKNDIQGFKDYMAFQNSEFAKYGTYEQFRQFITSKSSMEIENRLIETGKIDRVC